MNDRKDKPEDLEHHSKAKGAAIGGVIGGALGVLLWLPSYLIIRCRNTWQLIINPLTTIIMETAIREWSQPLPRPPLTVAVNLSPRTLQDPGLPRRISDMLAVYAAPPDMLSLEITENILMSDPARSMDCLTRLHEMGVRIVIDDFGTGYSSLSYLRRLPVDELKIDRSFIAALLTGQDDVIVRSTIDLAHNLGLRVVAEGVEDDEVLARLMLLGCDAAQGTFSRAPAPAAEIRDGIGRQNLLDLM